MKQNAVEPKIKDTMLLEAAWEVCNQVGGIYTVIRSKVPEMVRQWSSNYFLVGPYAGNEAATEYEEKPLKNEAIQKAVQACRDKGMDIRTGYWLVSGRPQTILFNYQSVYDKLGDIKYFYWEHHNIDFKNHDPLMDEVLAFGYMVYQFLSAH